MSKTLEGNGVESNTHKTKVLRHAKSLILPWWCCHSVPQLLVLWRVLPSRWLLEHKSLCWHTDYISRNMWKTVFLSCLCLGIKLNNSKPFDVWIYKQKYWATQCWHHWTPQSMDMFTRDILARAGLVHCDILPFLSLFHGLQKQVSGQVCHNLHLLIPKAPALEVASPCSSAGKIKRTSLLAYFLLHR